MGCRKHPNIVENASNKIERLMCELKSLTNELEVKDMYICHNCKKQFNWTDFSDEVWKLFCSFKCLYAWCRMKMKEELVPVKGE